MKENYPEILTAEELISRGAERIKEMTYYRLGEGIYEPYYDDDKKIPFYTLRRVFN